MHLERRGYPMELSECEAYDPWRCLGMRKQKEGWSDWQMLGQEQAVYLSASARSWRGRWQKWALLQVGETRR